MARQESGRNRGWGIGIGRIRGGDVQCMILLEAN